MKIEVLGTERRRRWSLQDKLQIVDETMQPGVSVTEVARRHGLAPSVVFTLSCVSIRRGPPCESDRFRADCRYGYPY